MQAPKMSDTLDTDAEARRRRRQETWTAEKKLVQDDEPDVTHLSVAERYALVWELTQNAWAFTGKQIHERGSLRHIVRVIRNS